MQKRLVFYKSCVYDSTKSQMFYVLCSIIQCIITHGHIIYVRINAQIATGFLHRVENLLHQKNTMVVSSDSTLAWISLMPSLKVTRHPWHPGLVDLEYPEVSMPLVPTWPTLYQGLHNIPLARLVPTWPTLVPGGCIIFLGPAL